MSTKAIREALEQWDRCRAAQDQSPASGAAREELEAIRKAATTLDRLSVGDFTYNIRDRVAGYDRAFEGNTWDHPDVKAWSEAAQTMGDIAKESK